MKTIIKYDTVENRIILSFTLIFLFGFTLFFVLYGFVYATEKVEQIDCLFERCKINISTGIRTCIDSGIIKYDPVKEVCTADFQCPSPFPCVDNGSFIDCSTNVCPNETQCNCYNFGQCPYNISMAWRKEGVSYISFSTGTINNKIYGIPIFPYTEYKSNIVSCRLPLSEERFINHKICTAGNYVKDTINGFVCCSYTDSCVETNVAF